MAGATKVCLGLKPDMNNTVPDFTEAEQALVSSLLSRRYSKTVPVQLADSELQLDAASKELTLCPTLYWSERETQFVVFKVAADRFRCQFFYSASEQFGTGRAEYDDLENCVTTLLQVQSDHERLRAQAPAASATISDLADDDYHGPVLI